MSEIGPAIIAITLVMTAVFVPMAFMTGPAGIFYRQSSLTMAVAIVLSGIVALTLTPALCAVLLRAPPQREHRGEYRGEHHEGHQSDQQVVQHAASHPENQSNARAPGWLGSAFATFNVWYERVENRYAHLLARTVKRKLLTLTIFGLCVSGVIVIAERVPAGFIPQEDQGVFYVSITTPPGATLERTKLVADAIQEQAEGLEGVESVATLAGTNILSDGTGATYGTALVNLKPWQERSVSVEQVIAALQARVQHLRDADIEFFPPPPIPGYGNASGFELRLLDKTGSGDFAAMEKVVQDFLVDLRSRPELGSAFSIFNASYPQYAVRLDLDKAAQKGVTLDGALGTLQTMLGSEYATNFIRFGQMYKVMVQASPDYRASPEQLMQLHAENDAGELVPLSAFATLEKVYGVDQITRYNMYPSAEVNGDGKPGVSSGAALRAVQETAREKLPRGYDIDWAGISRDEVNAGNQSVIVVLICLLFVYLVLSAKYESFVLPSVVILSLAPGVLGAFALLEGAGLENNIYTHIALVVLIGLLGKNAILIIEYAEHRIAAGSDTLTAVVEASRLRLRPILMTSFAFIAGLLPLAFATGAGAVGNRTIGTATASGMTLGTLVGVVLIPGLYYLVRTPLFSSDRIVASPHALPEAAE